MNKRQKEVEKFKLLQEKTVLNRLKRQFDMSEKQIAEKIRKLQKQIEDLTDKMKNADPQEALLIKSQIMAKVYQRDYQQQLKSQIDKFVDATNDAKNRTVEGYLNECYQTGFAGSMYDLHGQGIPIVMPIDKKDAERALKLNAKVSNRLYGGYMTLMKKQIQSEISRGLIQALSYSEMARNLHNVTNAGFNNTMRIVRTEGHRIQIQSALDACDKAKSAGADIVKQWDATLDGATRETHRGLDGKIAELDENFKYSGGEVSDPGMFGNPAEDCNCRCCILQRATWELDKSELKELKSRAEYYGLDKTDDFNDFKDKYLKVVENTVNSSKIEIRQTKDFDELSKYLKDSYDISVDESVTELDFETCKNVLSGMESVFIDFSELSANISKISTNNRGVMCCNGDVIYFNPKYFKDVSDFKEMCDTCSKQGWWIPSSTPASIGVHETAHAVEKLLINLDTSYTYDFQKILAWNDGTESKRIVTAALENIKKTPYGKGKKYKELVEVISRYGATNKSETLAEAFADVYANGENANALSIEIRRLTLERYKELKGE